MRLALLASTLIFALGTSLAHADTLRTFKFASTLDPNTGTGGDVSGTITIDTDNGTYSSSSLSSHYGANAYGVSSVEQTQATTYGSLVILSFGSISDPANAFLSLVLPTTSLVDYTGGTICFDGAACHEANNSNYTSSYFAPGVSFGDGFSSGALTLPPAPVNPPPTASSVTPEPSSLALLGTGLAGLAVSARRRLA